MFAPVESLQVETGNEDFSDKKQNIALKTEKIHTKGVSEYRSPVKSPWALLQIQITN